MKKNVFESGPKYLGALTWNHPHSILDKEDNEWQRCDKASMKMLNKVDLYRRMTLGNTSICFTLNWWVKKKRAEKA